MLAPAAFPAFFLTLSGFVLLLLVTLSVPIIKSIYLLDIDRAGSAVIAGTDIVANAHIGVFGLCYDYGAVVTRALSTTSRVCTSPAVGYKIDPTFFGESTTSSLDSAVIKGLAGSLILNPIACGVAGFTLFFALAAYFFASRIFEILTFVLLLFAQVISWIAFFLDLALALVARHRVNNDTSGAFTGHLGNAIWLALAGSLALSFANCFAGCGVFGRYSSHRDLGPKGVVAAPVAANGEPYRRRFFWQRDPARGTY